MARVNLSQGKTLQRYVPPLMRADEIVEVTPMRHGGQREWLKREFDKAKDAKKDEFYTLMKIYKWKSTTMKISSRVKCNVVIVTTH